MHDHNSESFQIETSRLVIRPIESEEIGEFHAIAKHRVIAENLASIPHPMSVEAASEWLAERDYQGIPEFVAGIFKPDETLVGCIGISDNPVTTYYFFASEYWGHGYATEVLNPFLDWCVKKFGITEIKVGVLQDNVGSRKVLERAGFRQTHVTLFQPPFRNSPDLLYMYWKGYGAPEPLTASTERLYIHPIHPGHANRLVELNDESDRFQVLGVVEPPFTQDSTEEWIMDSLNQSDVHRFAITRIDGLLTGTCELVVDKNAGIIKMWIGSIYWNKGYGDDAIRALAGLIFDRNPEVEKIICSVTQGNVAITQLMQTIGFKDMQVNSVPVVPSDDQTAANLICLTRENFEDRSRAVPDTS